MGGMLYLCTEELKVTVYYIVVSRIVIQLSQ